MSHIVRPLRRKRHTPGVCVPLLSAAVRFSASSQIVSFYMRQFFHSNCDDVQNVCRSKNLHWGMEKLKRGRSIRLTSLPSMSRLSRKCVIVDVPQTYRSQWPVTGRALLFTLHHNNTPSLLWVVNPFCHQTMLRDQNVTLINISENNLMEPIVAKYPIPLMTGICFVQAVVAKRLVQGVHCIMVMRVSSSSRHTHIAIDTCYDSP
jgi:hypothetical protein